MTAVELKILAADGMVNIGSHTVSHPILTSLSKTQQCAELIRSKQTLEDILEKPLTTLSYPHGMNNAELQRLVEDCGYQLACSSQNGIVHRNQNRFALPRFWVRDWDGEQFSRWLHHWMN
jgi:peptidoglycan/xylan/chitin deacetylase (PgdA/CDA1 family)